MLSSKNHKGFTLIELMITVAIIGILAAIAIPNYSAYVIRSKVTEATSTLAEQKVVMERWYQDNRNYGSTDSVCGPSLPTSSNFDYTCNWGTGGTTTQTFTLTATGKSTTSMNGFAFTIDHNNAKRTTNYGGDGVTRNCWISKRTDTC